MLSVVLRAHGYATERARDGAAALQALESRRGNEPPFQLVLLDLRLPVLDGEKLLIYLQTHYADLPVIVTSGDPAALAAARTLGARVVIEKPLDFDALLALVDRHARVSAR